MIQAAEMALKVVVLCLAVVLGSNAFPIEDEQDMSIFFDRDFIDSTDRIVGGTQAGNVNSIVALTTGLLTRGLHCAGTIINARHVLTAAHCMAAAGGNNPPNSLRGVVGTNRWNSGGSWFTFQRGIMHPAYNRNTLKNDIGILITASNILFSSAVQPVTIHNNWVGAGVATRVVGWGRTAVGGSVSATLLEIRPIVIDGIICANTVRELAAQLNIPAPAVDPILELCALLAAGRGTCHGDSGGPIFRTDNGQQIGVVAWGLPCARGVSDIFTRISAFVAWIRNNS